MDGDAASGALRNLRPEFGTVPFELRFAPDGGAAVRVAAAGGTVAARHAEAADPDAPWTASAHSGPATGWLLATAPPAHPGRAQDLLARTVDRLAAERARALAAERGRVAGELLDALTHRLRADVASLTAVTEGALRGLFDAAEAPGVLAEVRAGSDEAQRRLTEAREIAAVLHRTAAREPEPIVDLLRRELDAAGASTPIAAAEPAMALLPGHGWSACARRLAQAIARDPRLAGAAVTVAPDPGGWQVTAGDPPGTAVAWDEHTVGDLLDAGRILAVSGGSARAASTPQGGLHVCLVVPAAPS